MITAFYERPKFKGKDCRSAGYFGSKYVYDWVFSESDSDAGDSSPEAEVHKGAKPGTETKGRTTNWEKTGGLDQANDDFDTIDPDGGRPLDPDNPEAGRIGTTESGKTAIVQPASSYKTGDKPTPTLE